MCALLVFLSSVVAANAEASETPIVMRMDNFVVSPAHVPPAVVAVRNVGQQPYEGIIRLELPDGWTYTPATQPIALQPDEQGIARFTITKGVAREENVYPVVMIAKSDEGVVRQQQNVMCASAPYFKPQIDGDPADWTDAIPVTFTQAGKKTGVRTFWNRRQFSMLIAVEEDRFVPFRANHESPFDAVQIALSSQETVTAESPEADAMRYEFLFVGTERGGPGRCYQLAAPGMKLAQTAQERALAPLVFEKAAVAVKRLERTTYYECSVPFRSLNQIRPSEGREFFLSVLIHDPDGTGIRDWGKAAGLFDCERKRFAWSRWQGAKWPSTPLYDSKTAWGLCSSKY